MQVAPFAASLPPNHQASRHYGKHRFKIDAVGNADPTAAKDEFRVGG